MQAIRCEALMTTFERVLRIGCPNGKRILHRLHVVMDMSFACFFGDVRHRQRDCTTAMYSPIKLPFLHLVGWTARPVEPVQGPPSAFSISTTEARFSGTLWKPQVSFSF